MSNKIQAVFLAEEKEKTRTLGNKFKSREVIKFHF